MIITGPLVRHSTNQELNLWFVTDKDSANDLEVKVYKDRALLQESAALSIL